MDGACCRLLRGAAACLLCAGGDVPRIEQHHRRVGKVADVACHHGQAMFQRRRSNQRIESRHGLARSLGLGAQAGPISGGVACGGQSPLPKACLHMAQLDEYTHFAGCGLFEPQNKILVREFFAHIGNVFEW